MPRHCISVICQYDFKMNKAHRSSLAGASFYSLILIFLPPFFSNSARTQSGCRFLLFLNSRTNRAVCCLVKIIPSFLNSRRTNPKVKLFIISRDGNISTGHEFTNIRITYHSTKTRTVRPSELSTSTIFPIAPRSTSSSTAARSIFLSASPPYI